MNAEARRLWAPAARLVNGWHESVLLEWNAAGTLTRVTPGSSKSGHPQSAGPVVPGICNAHSHAFQRAMAGCAEHASASTETFWTWRKAMYELAGRLEPDQFEDLAFSLYVEMLEAGFTSVCEFHYLHHDPRGERYAEPAEMSLRILRAAERAGISITLLPVLYERGGFLGESLSPEQRRFVCSIETYQQLLGRLVDNQRPGVNLGVALHSLRAVTPAAIAEMESFAATVMPDAPIQIHVSEQRAEVEAAEVALGMTPIRWLTEHADLDSRWSLIHATHATSAELKAVAKRQVLICVCPTTEANLGDGILDLPTWLMAQGRLAIGTDSHIRVSLREELSWLEYAQRLDLERRAVMSTAAQPHSGAAAWLRCATGGAAAAGRRGGVLESGAVADFVVLDLDHPRLCGATGDGLFDRLVFAGSRDCLREVYVLGHRRVVAGRHELREAARERFLNAMSALRR